MTDIVERLRQDGYTLDGDVADPLLEEAACEIERLREAWADGKMKEDRCATAELRLKEAERKLAAIIALCSQEGCDGEPYDTFHAVATGEFDPHVRPSDSAACSCGKPAMHWISGANLCCECYVRAGNAPADWHTGCIRAADKKEDVSCPSNDQASS